MKLNTRREVLEMWSIQDDVILDMYCCPDCRDILKIDGVFSVCENEECLNRTIYTNLSKNK